MNYPYPKKMNNPVTKDLKKSKYKNKKIMYDNILFDSIKERNRYKELVMLEKAGVIKDLQRQVKFELQPSYEINNKKIREISYIADHVYLEKRKNDDFEIWEKVVEDVKGMKTDVYKLKKKMFEYKYQIEIKEI